MVSKGRVLIVEDNHINQTLFRKFISKMGFHSDVAENGREALDYLEVVRYDIILMDIMMPVMNGLECTKKIRSTNNPVIALTPIIGISANLELKNKALKAGMNSFIGKPVHFSILKHQIYQTLELPNKSFVNLKQK